MNRAAPAASPPAAPRTSVRLALVVGVAVIAMGACSSSKSGGASSPPTSRLTVITGPIPVPEVTLGPEPPTASAPGSSAASSPGSSATSATTAAPSGPPATTAAAGPACDATTLFAVLQASTSLPAGAGVEAPHCAPGWASMVVGAPGQDRALAVFAVAAGAWKLAGLGTDSVCSGAKVPAAVFAALDCAPWET